MDYGDWITLAVVIVALGLGLSSLIQTQSLQKRERKERLLDEIIEWAIDLNKATLGQNISLVSLKGRDLITAIYYGFAQLSSRSKYIKKIAPIFDKKLSAVVDEAINTLESCMETHLDWIACSDKNKDEKMEEAVKKQLEIEKIANKVIAEATEIQTRDIIS